MHKGEIRSVSEKRKKQLNIVKHCLGFYTRSSRTCRKDNPLTQLSLVGVRHLNEGAVLFIVKDFHPLDITVHPCMRAAGGQAGR